MRLLLHVRTAFLLIPEGLCHVGITSSLGHNRVKIWFHYGYYWLNKKLVLILILYYFSMNIVALLIGLCPSGGAVCFLALLGGEDCNGVRVRGKSCGINFSLQQLCSVWR